MTEATRLRIWSLLNETFRDVNQTLHHLPGIKMDCGHYRNEVFPFRAYAEFSVRQRTVVISVNIQLNVDHFDIWGDIAREDGFILQDMMQASVDGVPGNEERLIEKSEEFAERCKEEAAVLIAKEFN